jgi:uncharacterized membrane protein
LNNIAEASLGKVNASYGPEIIWNTVTFLAWLRAIELCKRESDIKQFWASSIVGVVFILKLGRELLGMRPFHFGPALIDLIVDCALALLWFSLWWLHSNAQDFRWATRVKKPMAVLAAVGATYWLVSTLMGITRLAYWPLHAAMVKLSSRGEALFNLSFVICAAIIIAVIKGKYPRFAARFGV